MNITWSSRTCRRMVWFFDSSYGDQSVVYLASYTYTQRRFHPHKKQARHAYRKRKSSLNTKSSSDDKHRCRHSQSHAPGKTFLDSSYILRSLFANHPCAQHAKWCSSRSSYHTDQKLYPKSNYCRIKIGIIFGTIDIHKRNTPNQQHDSCCSTYSTFIEDRIWCWLSIYL